MLTSARLNHCKFQGSKACLPLLVERYSSSVHLHCFPFQSCTRSFHIDNRFNYLIQSIQHIPRTDHNRAWHLQINMCHVISQLSQTTSPSSVRLCHQYTSVAEANENRISKIRIQEPIMSIEFLNGKSFSWRSLLIINTKNHLQFMAEISFTRQSRVTSLFTQLHSMRVWLGKNHEQRSVKWGRLRLFHHCCSQLIWLLKMACKCYLITNFTLAFYL